MTTVGPTARLCLAKQEPPSQQRSTTSERQRNSTTLVIAPISPTWRPQEIQDCSTPPRPRAGALLRSSLSSPTAAILSVGGLLFWKRVAGLLWEAYAGLMKLRLQAEKIRLQETARIDQTWQKREARAAYMREYRASRPVKSQFDDSRKATDAPSTNTFDGNPTAVESTSDVKELA